MPWVEDVCRLELLAWSHGERCACLCPWPRLCGGPDIAHTTEAESASGECGEFLEDRSATVLSPMRANVSEILGTRGNHRQLYVRAGDGLSSSRWLFSPRRRQALSWGIADLLTPSNLSACVRVVVNHAAQATGVQESMLPTHGHTPWRAEAVRWLAHLLGGWGLDSQSRGVRLQQIPAARTTLDHVREGAATVRVLSMVDHRLPLANRAGPCAACAMLSAAATAGTTLACAIAQQISRPRGTLPGQR